jgi:predicted Rdx family selenoprotein
VVANVVRDFEPDLTSLTLRPYDDGRFVVLLNGKPIYDKDRTGRFPQYDNDIKPKLSDAA